MVARIAVVALQGAVREHLDALTRLGAQTVAVKRPEQLDGVDALVLPGGESTTMSMLLERSELFEPVAKLLNDGMPALGTCAGMILLATEVFDGRNDQRSFGAIDIGVRRNAWGRQVDSFEADLAVTAFDDDFHAVFIRAPRVERVGDDVEVLAKIGDEAVLCRSGAIVVSSFHPELSSDLRIHQLFLEGVS
ncbi:MAG TPA: pyridoxal 5'-phosphate synthase glutaminase subunit PdxT [Acidimicrobiales bacterium]|nr:pyridoxal 5'-phosphate synthase glutaminase subunit PdxT [Acidimicrobiales bacterium]